MPAILERANAYRKATDCSVILFGSHAIQTVVRTSCYANGVALGVSFLFTHAVPYEIEAASISPLDFKAGLEWRLFGKV